MPGHAPLSLLEFWTRNSHRLDLVTNGWFGHKIISPPAWRSWPTGAGFPGKWFTPGIGRGLRTYYKFPCYKFYPWVIKRGNGQFIDQWKFPISLSLSLSPSPSRRVQNSGRVKNNHFPSLIFPWKTSISRGLPLGNAGQDWTGPLTTDLWTNPPRSPGMSQYIPRPQALLNPIVPIRSQVSKQCI